MNTQNRGVQINGDTELWFNDSAIHGSAIIFLFFVNPVGSCDLGVIRVDLLSEWPLAIDVY
jgi:hypothetical protein